MGRFARSGRALLVFLLASLLSGAAVAADKPAAKSRSKAKAKAAPKEQQSVKMEQRKIELPGHGTLLLNMPATWQQLKGNSMEGMPAVTIFRPEQGDDFEVQLLPLWSPNNDPGFNSQAEVKRLAEMDAGVVQATEAEKGARLKTFTGKSGTGYYYFDLYFAQRPGGPDQAMRASIAVRDLLVNVTVICRSKEAPVVAEVLQMLAGADKAK